MIRELLGFVEELPLDYKPQPDARDLREPVFLKNHAGRRLIIDPAVLDPMRGAIPADETASRVVQIQDVRAVRPKFQSRVMC